MLRSEGLTKTFEVDRKVGKITAVDRLNLDVKQGEVFGFLGPNGAGKTTTVRMLCTLIGPTAGRAWVNDREVGRDDAAIRASVGILTEQPGLYDRLSAGQVEKYLRMLGLWERRRDPAGSFSKGMKQKLAIARAILHEPKTLFLDEPTAGLDPEAAKLVRDFIEELKTEGRTIFLCTHNLDEADRLCDRIGVFKQRLIRVDTPSRMRTSLFGRTVEFRLRRVDESIAQLLKRFDFVKNVEVGDGRLIVGMDNPEAGNPPLVRALVEAGVDVQFVNEVRHSLEDVYFSLINGNRQE
jgi:ABC-2 type transport system ATP-binding protein